MQIIVGVLLADVGVREYFLNFLNLLCSLQSRLIIYYTYCWYARLCISHPVQTVDNSANSYIPLVVVFSFKCHLGVDGILQCEYLKRSDFLVAMKQLAQIFQQHFAVDQMQSVVVRAALCVLHLKQFFIECTVNNILQQTLCVKIFLYCSFFNLAIVVLCNVVVYQLCRFVEYIAEHTVVYYIVIAVGFLYVCHILIEEL